MGISAILHNQCYVDTNQHYEKTLYRGKRMVEPQGGQHTTSRLRTVVECTSKRRHPLLGRGSSFFESRSREKLKVGFYGFGRYLYIDPCPSAWRVVPDGSDSEQRIAFKFVGPVRLYSVFGKFELFFDFDALLRLRNALCNKLRSAITRVR